MFFKKQAFKIKDLLKDSGMDVSLVTIQEILAKSYGFNNRHVILNDDHFNRKLDSVFEVQPNYIKNNHLEMSVSELPVELSRNNINDYIFWWNQSGDDFCIYHHEEKEDGNPYHEDYFSKDMSFFVYEKGNNDELKYSFIEYHFCERSNSFKRQDIIKSFLFSKKGLKFYKEFNQLDISKNEILQLLNNCSTWDEKKRILKHKDCPIEVLKENAKDPKFFVRIVAIFSSQHRSELSYLGKIDPDSRVRRAYYGNLLGEFFDISTEPIRRVTVFNEIAESSKKDGTASTYFERILRSPIINQFAFENKIKLSEYNK